MIKIKNKPWKSKKMLPFHNPPSILTPPSPWLQGHSLPTQTDSTLLYLQLRHFETPSSSSSLLVLPSRLLTPSASAAKPSPLRRANTMSIPCCYVSTRSATLTTYAKTARRSNSRLSTSSDPTHSKWRNWGTLLPWLRLSRDSYHHRSSMSPVLESPLPVVKRRNLSNPPAYPKCRRKK